MKDDLEIIYTFITWKNPTLVFIDLFYKHFWLGWYMRVHLTEIQQHYLDY